MTLMVGCSSPAATIDAPVAIDAANTHLVVYASGTGSDIAWFSIDRTTAALTPVASTPAFAGNPSFLAVEPSGHYLYAVSEATSRVGAYAIAPATGALTFINDVATGGTGPAHVAVDRGGRFVLVANYGDGSISVFPIAMTGAVGSIGAAQQTLIAGSHAHMIITDPANQFVLVPCLGSDYVAQYAFDPSTGMLAANSVPHAMTAAGAGPRHVAFAPDGGHAYVINELDSTITSFAYDAQLGRLSAPTTVSTLAAPKPGNTGAEVISDGAFVYGSNRGDNTIVTMTSEGGTLAPIGWAPTAGTTPRSFALAGTLGLVADQGSNTIVSFTVVTGVWTASGASTSFTGPEFVAIIALPD